MKLGINSRPNKPGSPHLNGKVERSQKTDKTEFYATIDVASENLDYLLTEWQQHYNWDRLYGAHKGKTPMERYLELCEETPLSEDAYAEYQPSKGRIQEANYKLDLELARFKRCL